ncbi:MAG TPA: ribosome biogenesis GTP-binding protein YihA/YsxC [Gammaproteobacteria bacterium]|nr:ribosome biogenesis GTP-binding protein YihA/YsxC [Gammaproteobacteria bacterium]
MTSAVFLKSAATPADFPADTGREVAFVGRSNSGKSTALNVVTGARKLARVSKTPGRTQLLNFFSLGEDRRLVDLPGYGFARVAPEVQARWQKSLETYLSSRASLAGLIVTMDIRRGITRLDEQLLRWLESHRELPVAVLLTKADKLSRSDGMAQQRTLGSALGPHVRVAKFSAVSGEGVEDAKAWIESWLSGVQK